MSFEIYHMASDHVPSGRPAVAEMAEQLQHLSQAEARDLAELLEAKWGIALNPFRSLYPIIIDGYPPWHEDDKLRFNVVVTNVGPNRLVFIKEARAIMELGVLELDALIKSVPLTVARGLKAEEAAWIKRRIEDSGASVEVRPV